MISLVDTPQGPGRFLIDPAESPDSVLVLGHGAGGNVASADLQLLADRLPERGTTVVRFEQPWRTSGRKMTVGTPLLDQAWLAALAWLVAQPWAGGRLFTGGRSAGARVACRTAPALDVTGIICLAFPLHLPGQPDKSRAAELLTPAVPRLVLQGTRDSFGSAAEVQAAAGHDHGVLLRELPGADHSYRVARSAQFGPAALRASVLDAVSGFIAGQQGISPT